jgi:hypothetical protein
MKIRLVNPPLGSITQPFLALGALQAALKSHGHHDVKIVDVSQRIVCRYFDEDYLRALVGQLDDVISCFESQATLGIHGAKHYQAALFGKVAAEAAVPHVAEAMCVLRSPTRFFDLPSYHEAMATVDHVFQALSGLHYPEYITREDYCASVAEDLDCEVEVRSYVGGEGRCMFRRDYLDIIDELSRDAPDIVGLSATFQNQFLPSLVFAYLLKQRLPNTHIVLGGAFPSARVASICERPWLFDYLDSVIFWEGETALTTLARCLAAGEPLASVPNMAIRVDGSVTPPAHRFREDLRALPPPDYTGFDIGLYFVPGWDVLYDPTRGCYWNKCNFCTVSMSAKGSDRARPAAMVVDHIEQLCDRYKTKVISFAVDAIPVSVMREIAEEIVRRRLDVGWSSEFILDRELDLETIALFADAGCLLLLFGLESASPRVVKQMKKGTLVDRSARIIRDCRKARIGVLLHIMIGFPGETEEDLECTLRFVEELGACVDLCELNAFHLDEGAPIIGEMSALGITSASPTKRLFNIHSIKPYRVASGITPDQAVALKEEVRERLDTAIGLKGRRHLRDDDAHMHYYLKRTGLRPREMASPTSAGHDPTKLIRPDVPLCSSPFDLTRLVAGTEAASGTFQRLSRVSPEDSKSLWAKVDVEFDRGGGFVGVVDVREQRFVQMDDLSFETLRLLRSDPQVVEGRAGTQSRAEWLDRAVVAINVWLNH